MGIFTKFASARLLSAKGEFVIIKIKRSNAHRTNYRMFHRTLCYDIVGKRKFICTANDIYNKIEYTDTFVVVGVVGMKEHDKIEMMWQIADGILTATIINKFINKYESGVIVCRNHKK